MSDSSDRGKHFELKVASILRRKLGAKVTRDRRSGAGVNKADISDYYQSIPLHLELKDQETLKIKEWFRQADASASFSQAPTVVFAMDEEILCCLRFSDLVNFMVELADQRAEIDDLRRPIAPVSTNDPRKMPKSQLIALIEKKSIEPKTKFCRNDHIADQFGYCIQTACPYSRGYKKPKAKKK